jgi:hypothetical protein
LSSGQARQELALERCARWLGAKATDPAAAGAPAVSLAPMYLLLSQEEGGFARFGFWLESAEGQRKLVMASYVDLVVNQAGVDNGGFEEIFCHELGHAILRSLLGNLSHGPSRKMHQSMTITDYPTAFDEGYAEHFQPLVRDSTTNLTLRRTEAGVYPMDMELFWLSNFDGQLRTDGVKRNVFVRRKVLPEVGDAAAADLYRAFLAEETSTEFRPGVFKNAQEMMASEGVIATLFYRLVNHDGLRAHYREAAFYDRFLEGGTRARVDPRQTFDPYENINLKLFAAMRRIAPRAGDPGCPLAIALIKAYAQLFPDEAQSAYGVFLDTTYAVTVTPDVAAQFERAAAAGRLGDLDAFRQDSHAAFALLDQITDRVVKGDLALDANVGPEIWLLNENFKIAPAAWVHERTVPLSLNLNTASEAELMTVPGIDGRLARRIVAARRSRRYFRSLGEVDAIEGVSPALSRTLQEMADKMKKSSLYVRQ